MAKYLLKVSYSAEGIKGVMKEGGTSRAATIEKILASVGGSLESFYFAFGTDDVYVIADVPDHATAMAVAAAVGSSGAVSSYETVVLVEPSEVDAAMNISVGYRPPGS
ncbi:MAG: GYD domain-containing protein [Actinomycetia bacterium]|nr:GYD domain-containing protein [Actinomycetes bacterium]